MSSPGVAFRLGGLVEKGSVQHGAGADVRFIVTDGKSTVPVDFNGVLPALFREGQGVVATGAHGRERHLRSPPKCWPSMMRNTCRRKWWRR